LIQVWCPAKLSPVHDELALRLARTLGIGPREADRVIGDVLAYFHEPLEELVKRRHAECRRRGLSNAQIYPLLVSELRARVVAAPPVSERQVRRIIYG
jgi:hypothetical protein